MTKQEILTNWKQLREALASGEYEKNEGALRDGYKFCCLGVATDLKINETDCDLSTWERTGTLSYDVNKWSSAALIEPIADLYGLKELPELFDSYLSTGEVIHMKPLNDSIYPTLAKLNDSVETWEPIIAEIDIIINHIETKEF